MSDAPVAVFALDGADATIIERLMTRGDLPTLASIVERGGRGRIVGRELFSTTGAWLTLFSGTGPNEHGYYAERQLSPGSYSIRATAARDARTEPFWTAWAGSARTVALLDAPETRPVAGLSGYQLSGWSVQHAFDEQPPAPLAEPSHLIADARRLVGDPIHVDVFKPNSRVADDEAALQALLANVRAKGELCRNWLATARFDLVVASFFEAHTAAHRLWDYRIGGTRNGEARRPAVDLATSIETVYRGIDRELGDALDRLPPDTNVFVASLFGMKDLYPTDGLLESFCERLAYSSVKRARVAFDPLALARRMIGADLRARLGDMLPGSLKRRLLPSFEPNRYDWTRTTAFALPSLHTGYIRINCRGREPQGIVDPGAEYEDLAARIEADLRCLIDDSSGEPAVADVIRTTKAFGGGPPESLPDLIVEWRAAPYLRTRVRHPEADIVQAAQHYNRSSHHTMCGFLAACGPSIRSVATLGDISPLEFAPALRSLLGDTVARDRFPRLAESMLARASA